jgi:hypothetical protein
VRHWRLWSTGDSGVDGIRTVLSTWAEVKCEFSGSTQHLLSVYWQESGSPTSFWDVDSSAARPGRAAVERWATGRFLGGSIVATVDWCFRSCRAARDSAG